MPFYIIKGSYHLVGKTSKGRPSGFEPDGDSMQFKPDNPALLDKLDRVDKPYRLSSIGSTQLRFEGIDALELHFEGHHQPRELADASRDYLTGLLGMNPVSYIQPNNITVKPPVPHDGIRGYILSRALEAHGRPVSFVYAGDPDGRDGDKVTLHTALLRKSINYKSIASGNAYPLFYDSLFASLRTTLAAATAAARAAKKGLWAEDRTTRGLTVTGEDQLQQDGVIYPKVFRRLTSFFDADPINNLGDFLAWLAPLKEQVLDLTTGNFTHLDNVLQVKGGKIKLTVKPEDLVIVSAKTTNTKIAPWMAH
jgi:endonuclease YncB( thermonuclease family)